MRSIAINYGLRMFAGFTTLFLIMHLAGLSQNPNLRVLNGFVHASLLYFAIKQYQHQERRAFNYLSGVAVGVYASMVGVFCFAIFQMIFLELNPSFMAILQQELTVGAFLNPITASIIIFVEGVAISVIASYVITRILDMQLARPFQR